MNEKFYSKLTAIGMLIHIVIRMFFWSLGVTATYFTYAIAIELGSGAYKNALIKTVDLVTREVSPDQSSVALVYHRFKLNDLFFSTTITDTVAILKTKEEAQFMRDLRQNDDEDIGVVVRYSRFFHPNGKLIIRWLSADQLKVTAPVNAYGSFIVLPKQTVDGISVAFSFKENAEATEFIP